MFSLTVREQLFVVTMLLAVVAGGIIHHLRHRLPTDAVVTLPEATHP